jgi:hypothetical protein
MSNPLQIIVTVRNVYGRETVYPVCEKAQLFATLTNAKTLTPHALTTIKALGYAVVQSTLPSLKL